MLFRRRNETPLLSTDKCKSEIVVPVYENYDVILNKTTTLTNLSFSYGTPLGGSNPSLPYRMPHSLHADKKIWPTTKE